LKRRTPRGVWALRGVTAAIALVVLFVVAAVAYSAYEDYSAVRPYISDPQHPPGTLTLQGTTGTITFNVTIPNRGVFDLNVTVTCDAPPPGVTCQRGSVSVPPGQVRELVFTMTIADVQQFAAQPDHTINGTVSMGLVPFAALTATVNFGGIIRSGGP
jgi:uncharacterized repeat protein (TIGR01451 family)